MGTFQGHAIPAAFFFGFGTFLLLLSLRRAKSLPPGTSFVDSHVPERNKILVRSLGNILVTCTALGFVYEGIGGARCCQSFWFEASHMALYTSFFFVGCVMLAESRGCLPLDSSRAALAMALFLETILWHDHAIMKDDVTERRLHIIMAQICLAGSVVFGYSVCRPDNILAYISGWAMLVLQSFWLITAGIHSGIHELHRHIIGVLLCIEILVVVSLILTCFICFGPALVEAKEVADASSRRVDIPSRSERRSYGRLTAGDEEDDEEDTPVV